MTAPDVVELGRRAVACGAWRPVQGMADASGEVVVRVHDDGTVTTSQMVDASRGYDSWQELWTGRLDASWLPDLSDAATLGALLGLVRATAPEAVREGVHVAVSSVRATAPEAVREGVHVAVSSGPEGDYFYRVAFRGRNSSVYSMHDAWERSLAAALVCALEAAPVRS